jgi:Ca-activated chloride channel family protein
MSKGATLILGMALALPVWVVAQSGQRTLRVNVEVVSLNVRVTDPGGRSILGLKPEQFQIWEDRVEQKIESFSTEEIPASVGLVIDISASMKDVVKYAREAAVTFAQMGTTQDEFFAIAFNTQPRLLMDFTRNVSELQNRIALETDTGGRTALYDAMYMAVEKVKKGQHARKAIVTITDGQDNRSRYTARDFEELMREQDIQVVRLPLIDGEAIAAVCARVSAQLRNQYLIGYRSTNPTRDGKWRDIRVAVNLPKGYVPVNVQTRRGYYAPAF